MKRLIHQYDFWYGALRSYVKIYLFTFYDKITVVGKEKIPKGKPIIFAINHQNALMDPMAVLGNLKGQPVFMARADIFQSKVIAKILHALKILPIFRIRDGRKNLQNNDAVFEEAIGVLQAKKILAILPEGNHFGERRLRALKKGIARIAFQAEERNNFELDVQIVPVGLDYSHYINFGADLLVNFGDPFPINKYKNLYLENPQKGMNNFLEELKQKMIPQMLNINDSENYNEIEALKDIFVHHLLANRELQHNHKKIVDKSQEISNKVIELKNASQNEFERLGKTALEIKDGIREMGIRYWVLAHKKYNWIGIILSYILLIALFPFFVFGFATNFIPFYLPVVATRKIKDPQFVSSIRFAASIITFTLFYLTYIIVLLVFIEPWPLAIGIMVSIFLFGILSFRYFIGFKKTGVKMRVNIWKIKKNRNWLDLKQKWDATVAELTKIIER